MHVDLTNWKVLPSPSEKNLPLGINLVSDDRCQATCHPLERQITHGQKHMHNSRQSCGSGEAGSNVVSIIWPPQLHFGSRSKNFMTQQMSV